MLLDSNIIIYSCQMHNEKLRILVNDHHTLITRNVKDFDWIEGLKVVDPLVGL